MVRNAVVWYVLLFGLPNEKVWKNSMFFLLLYVFCTLSSDFFWINAGLEQLWKKHTPYHCVAYFGRLHDWKATCRDDLEVGTYQKLQHDHLPSSIQRRKVELTLATHWSKLCDTWGIIFAANRRSIGFGTFCNQGLFPATRGWISSSVCKMLLHIGDAMAEWWNHHAAGGFVFFTFARCSACFSSSFTMA